MDLKKILTYIRVGYLLHAVTFLEIIGLYFLYDLDKFSGWLYSYHAGIKFLINTCLISIPFFPQLDARSRYQNYKMVRDQFYLYGFQPRIVRPFIISRCQRDAVLAAADDLGYTHICRKHFYDCGYRWYHLMPDFLFRNPAFLLKRRFWETTFFAKHYQSRIDYSAVAIRKKPFTNAAA